MSHPLNRAYQKTSTNTKARPHVRPRSLRIAPPGFFDTVPPRKKANEIPIAKGVLMKHFQNNQHLFSFMLILPTVFIISSCGLGDTFSRYTQVSVAPEVFATFSDSTTRDCSSSPFEVERDAIPPETAQFQGIGAAGVGHSGLFVHRDRHAINAMHTAIKFDLEAVGIPPESINETMIANIVFTYNLTPPSARDRTCHVPISRPNIATVAWDGGSSFDSPLPSRPFTMVGCELISGSRTDGGYTCLVSKAVVDWLRDPAANPNNGFVINPPNRVINACASNFGEPGDRLECVSELSNIGMNIHYIAP